MPHITVNIVPGHSEDEKRRLAQKLHQTAQNELNMDGKLISVSIQEVTEEQWPAFIHDISDSSFYIHPAYLENKERQE